MVAFSVEERYDSPVDFSQVLKTLLTEFDRRQIRYAAIGGFAMGVLGAPRGTFDVDFLVHRDHLTSVHELMTSLGYQRFAYTENASHYLHQDKAWGAVDYLHAFRPIALGMLERTRAYPVFEGTLQIRVAQPEDVIGLKVQAMANNPLRRAKDQFDIEALMERYGSSLDWKRLQGYYDLFEMGREVRPLRKRFDHAQ